MVVGLAAARMVREHVRCSTGCYGVGWFPMVVLGGRAGGSVGVSALGCWSEVCTGDGGGAVAESLWSITLEDPGGFTLGSGWVFCYAVEYGGISSGGLGRKMLWMRVRSSNSSV